MVETPSSIEVPTFSQSAIVGAIGFGAASVTVFATVAFGEGWMYANMGLEGAYVAWTLMFILLGGCPLAWLVRGRMRIVKWYLLFSLAFASYAGGWTASYFLMSGRSREWIGSLLGSVLMAVVFAGGFRAWNVLWKLAGIIFLANSCGYFLGEIPFKTMQPPVGMLLWGVIYGGLLGAGLGVALAMAQNAGGPDGYPEQL